MAVYRVPVLENFVWQPSIKSRISQTALEALAVWTKGWRYLMTSGANDKKIAYANTSGTGAYVAGDWTYDSPLEGMIVWVDDENKYYHYDGSTWTEYLGQQGIQGTHGTKGSKGSQGTHGTKGSKGSQGTHGTKGSKGSQGTHGTKGSKGSQGTKGPGATYSASYGCLIISTS